MIKSLTVEEKITYCYYHYRRDTGDLFGPYWLEGADRHGEVVAASGAPNEVVLVSVDEIVADENWVSMSDPEGAMTLSFDADAKNTHFLAILRTERNKRLANCDWTQLADAPLTDFKKSQWITYRQELRDLPANTVNYDDPIWPSEPSE